MSEKKAWDINIAKRHYRVANWSAGLFDINELGHMVAKNGPEDLDLFTLAQQLEHKGITLPALVRFPHILQFRLQYLYAAFHAAMQSCNYAGTCDGDGTVKGKYIAAYPIKVNQQQAVIQHYQQQTEWPLAFEVGSKAELIACLGIIQEPRHSIICNGYKDEDYIRLALIGSLLGHNIIIVLESLHELQYVHKQSTELNVQPTLGMRVRLSSIAQGNWQNTGGQHSKFGFTANEVLSLAQQLNKYDVAHWVQMLHFHMGSQISALDDIQTGIQEGLHYFVELQKLGLPVDKLNIGGGLAVDYEGSASNSYFSMDYCVEDYANCVVQNIEKTCRQNNIQAPIIFTESGRAMTAHHAVLITNVINTEVHALSNDNEEFGNEIIIKKSSNHSLQALTLLGEQLSKMSEVMAVEIDIAQTYEKIKQLCLQLEQDFRDGKLLLIEKAYAETMLARMHGKILTAIKLLKDEERLELEEKLLDKYFCNFSVFQSVPDVWGLGQIFPIMPLHRLDEFPAHRARILDLTCDSDGQINQYIEAGSIKPYISLHHLQSEQSYLLGLFMVGAYQEILGDLHNLFGDTYTAKVTVNSDGGYEICEEEHGDCIEDILSYVHIDSKKVRQTWLGRLGKINIPDKTKEFLLHELESSLKVSSYLN